MRCGFPGCRADAVALIRFKFWAAANPRAVAVGTPQTPIGVCAGHSTEAHVLYPEESKTIIQVAFTRRGLAPPDRFDVELLTLH